MTYHLTYHLMRCEKSAVFSASKPQCRCHGDKTGHPLTGMGKPDNTSGNNVVTTNQQSERISHKSRIVFSCIFSAHISTCRNGHVDLSKDMVDIVCLMSRSRIRMSWA